MTGLYGLRLENNYIVDLPTTITNLTGLGLFDVQGNCLVTTDPTVVAYLDSQDPDWATNQAASCDVVSGRVVDATTTLPIGSLVINADPDEQGGPGYGACTNADGYYTLIDLPLATASISLFCPSGSVIG